MSTKKIIVVVGATGNQGSSVAHTFLKLPNWHVRCVTRNPSSPASQALTSLGAEVIKANLSELSTLTPAFQNANAIFVNTDFWGTYRDPNLVQTMDADSRSKLAFETEVLHGTNAAIAASTIPTLERFVYSTLPFVGDIIKEKYPDLYAQLKFSHWDSKGTIVSYIENEQPSLAKKASFIYLGAYVTNAALTPRFDPASGKHVFLLPIKAETKMPIINQKVSTGAFVQALIESEPAGTKLLAYDTDSYLPMSEIAKLWSKASGKEAPLVTLSAEIIHQQFKVPMEILVGPELINEFGYMGNTKGWIEPGGLKEKVVTKSFETWLGEQDWKKLLAEAEKEMKSVSGGT